MKVVLYDVDSKIPNLALMKLSQFFKNKGYQTLLAKKPQLIAADQYYASVVFNIEKSHNIVKRLTELYGDKIVIGGTGEDLVTTLTEEVDNCFPDYDLYNHTQYALGFLTRGCNKKCAFCVVPQKEGLLQANYSSFKDFVPKGQQNVMLLDNNLLVVPNINELLEEMVKSNFNINFSQTLDIQYLTEDIYLKLRRVNSVNSRFTRKMIYFSCNTPKQAEWFVRKADMLKGFGREQVTSIIMFGFNTRLSQDFSILKTMKKLGIIPFVQEYLPIPGVPAKIPENYFDMDLDELSEFRIRSNGQNGEKFLRYVSKLYFDRYGKYYLPLLKAIYRYNNKPRIQYYLDRPEQLSVEMYKSYK